MNNPSGIILSAPSSGCGKTTITLALLRALKREGLQIKSAKSGPDYIDTRFHAEASGSECYNLDAWAMNPDQICKLANEATQLIVEGAMGLFDGAPPDGKGSTAHLATILNLPIILILDASSQAQSVAALTLGFQKLDPNIKISGIILNKVGSDKHKRILTNALKPLGIPILGSIYRHQELSLPSRHLGLVQAQELENLDEFLNNAAEIVTNSIDIKKNIKVDETYTKGKTRNKFIFTTSITINFYCQ